MICIEEISRRGAEIESRRARPGGTVGDARGRRSLRRSTSSTRARRLAFGGPVMSAVGVMPSGETTSCWGMIHGRFQPFRSGHFAYLCAAAARSDRMLVGITNPDSHLTEPSPSPSPSPRRALHLPEANPSTYTEPYTERLLMIEGAVKDAGLDIPVKVIPFLSTVRNCGPTMYRRTPSTTCVCSPLGAVSSVIGFGWRPRCHRPRRGADKEISGESVRTVWRAEGSLDGLVPPSVASLIKAAFLPSETRLHSPV